MKKLLNQIYDYLSLEILICVIVVTGVVIRLWYLPQEDLWYDEAFSALTIVGSWGDLWNIIRDDLLHPPVYYLMLKIWTDLLTGFGVYGPYALRSFSLIWGVMLIPMPYVVFGQILKTNWKTPALIGSVFVAFSPFFVSYSIEVRSYSMVAFLASVNLIVFWKAIFENQKKWMYFSVIIIVVNFLVHYMTLFWVGVVVLSWFAKRTLENKSYEQNWFRGLVISGVTLGIGLPVWVARLNVQTLLPGRVNLGWIERVDFASILKIFTAYFWGVDANALGVPPINLTIWGSSYELGFVLFVFFVVCLTYYLVQKTKEKLEEWDVMIFLAISILPIFGAIWLSYVKIDIMVERYLIGFGFVLLMLVSYVLSRALTKENVIYLVGFYFLIATFGIRYSIAPKSYSAISDLVSKQNPEVIVVEDPLDFVVLKYYVLETTDFGRELKVLEKTRGEYGGWAMIDENDGIARDEIDLQNSLIIDNTGLAQMEIEGDVLGESGNFRIVRVK